MSTGRVTSGSNTRSAATCRSLRAHWARYLCVVVSGFLEVSVRAAFEKYVEGGGGFAVYHFAVESFAEWEAYNKMIGMGWRDNKFGDRLSLDDNGKLVGLLTNRDRFAGNLGITINVQSRCRACRPYTDIP